MQKIQDDLVLVYGDDSITIKGWYLPNSNTIEQINFSNAIYDANGDYLGQSNVIWDKTTIIANAPASNHAPEVVTLITAQSATDGSVFSYTIPTNIFQDVDVGDVLSYSVRLDDGTANGAALPSWLSYDAITRTLSGTPSGTDIGSTFALKVTATDLAGASANTSFMLGVIPAPDQSLVGTAGNDTLTTLSGNDTIDGGAGTDTMSGGLGNDTYIVDSTADVVTENANAGTDTILSSATYTLSVNLENLTLTGTTAINGTGNVLNNVLTGNSATNVLAGGAGNDTYYVSTGDTVTEAANAGTDTVNSDVTFTIGANIENLNLTGIAAINGTGNTLTNVITGNSANNTLNGGTGADTLIGGLGNDIYVVDNLADVVSENVAEGTDTVQTAINLPALAANVENLTLTGTAAINGSGNELDNTLTGNAASNTLNGGVGNDTLNGAAGTDTLIGGAGNDTYIVDNVGDVITENANEGTDTVQTAMTLPTLAANVENLTLTGTAAVNATGNTLDNVLTGNSAINTLNGGVGNDTLNGAAGADTLIGGLGDDTYIVDNIGDVITENANEGIDSVNSSVTYTLATNVENLTLTGTANINATGNELNNILTGNSGNNILNGGLGADTMTGGAGNNTYVVDNVGDVVIEAADAGADIVQSSISYVLAANVENLTLTGTDAINGMGNALANSITGNAGNNILDGGVGADTLIGGLGDDTYLVDNVLDVITEAASAGTDTVLSNASFTLSTNLENLTLTGTEAINGIGNTLANAITGNSADNTLSGGTGADTLVGAAGNDTYIVDNIGDVVTENLNEGMDSVSSSVTYTLSTNLENITLTGAAAINATGNELNNTLTGNTGNNILSGGLGADSMAGGLGNDTYVVDNVGDQVTEATGAGTDLVQSSLSYIVTADVENLTLTSTDAINGTGNDLNNTITGNTAANILEGGLGVDTLKGGAGDDVYIVDSTTDVITELAGEGSDTIKTSVTLTTLAANVENITIMGTASLNATGNTLNNVITGNSADNVLSGGTGADTMIGGAGNDTYVVDNIVDIVTENTNEGIDTINSSVTYTLGNDLEHLVLTGTAAINATGNVLNNYLLGNTGNNSLFGLTGNDILQGQAGNDTLNDNSAIDGSEHNLLAAAAGTDTLLAGAGNELLIGGTGNDTITTSTGYDVISFNKGDGADIINASTGADNTLSLGGAFAYSDLSFTKTGNNLILKMGATDQITLKDWYLGTTNHSIVNLQVIAEAVTGFSLGSADALRNNKIENFNFANIVAAFDAQATKTNWAFTDTMLTTHLQAGSDTAAIGGDLAYQYGKNSNLTGIGLIASQNVINAASFGQTAQTLNAPSTWAAETVKLG